MSGWMTLEVTRQVTPRRVPVVVSNRCVSLIWLFVPTAVVLTTQPRTAVVAQDTVPDDAAPQAAIDGFAALPIAAQFVTVA